ncbi:hypothetical protein V3851_09235 [Paenibacillus sp. M1]|uniref:Uncharacterized protein n=1 Tax=Paenibacillus haidiansis TaxID=1574488 RepID=A0ABU7VRL2_9BACL
MSKLLKGISYVFFGGSLLAAIIMAVYGGLWSAAFLQLVGGFLPGILFLALAVILDSIEENRYYLQELFKRLPEPPAPPSQARPQAKIRTKSALEALKDYKMDAKD